MHEKLPTDENLRLRGCSFPSMCSLCCRNSESSIHLFFQCPFASILWAWLSRTINMSLNFNSLKELWKVCDLAWSPQCKVVIKAAIINLFNTIWYARNQARFNDKRISCPSAMAMITSNTTLSGNSTSKVSNNAISDFTILKKFNVRILPPKTLQLKEIIWQPPLVSWLKCNIDGASKGNPGMSGCGGIFRNSQAEAVCCFAEPIGISNSFTAELCAFMRAIAIAKHHNWHNIWIETDSALVLMASKHPEKVPWELRNRWCNSMVLFRHLNCMVSHVFREGNKVADALANHVVSLTSLSIWFDVPLFINDSFLHNKSGLPAFRFCN